MQEDAVWNAPTTITRTEVIKDQPTPGEKRDVYFKTPEDILSVEVTDDRGNVLTPGPRSKGIYCFYQEVVPPGVTEYRVTYTARRGARLRSIPVGELPKE